MTAARSLPKDTTANGARTTTPYPSPGPASLRRNQGQRQGRPAGRSTLTPALVPPCPQPSREPGKNRAHYPLDRPRSFRDDLGRKASEARGLEPRPSSLSAKLTHLGPRPAGAWAGYSVRLGPPSSAGGWPDRHSAGHSPSLSRFNLLADLGRRPLPCDVVLTFPVRRLLGEADIMGFMVQMSRHAGAVVASVVTALELLRVLWRFRPGLTQGPAQSRPRPHRR